MADVLTEREVKVVWKERGSGTFGQVFQGKYGGEEVAVKIFKTKCSKVMIQREIATLSSAKHPNIVLLHGSFVAKDDRLGVVMEWIPQTLDEALKSHQNLDLWKILVGTAKGIQYLHEKGILHRDIKSHNIMLTLTGEAKLSDFGTARAFKGTDSNWLKKVEKTMKVGTALFASPEVRRGANYGYPADIYSFGMTIKDIVSYYDHIEGNEAEFLETLSNSCTAKEDKRPTIQEILHLLKKNRGKFSTSTSINYVNSDSTESSSTKAKTGHKKRKITEEAERIFKKLKKNQNQASRSSRH